MTDQINDKQTKTPVEGSVAPPVEAHGPSVTELLEEEQKGTPEQPIEQAVAPEVAGQEAPQAEVPPVDVASEVAPVEEAEPSKPKEQFRNMNSGEGINLVPGLSEEEEVLEEKKLKFNTSGMGFMVALAAITIAVLGVNAYYRILLNGERKQVETLKTEVLTKSYLANNNNQILDRIYLLKDIESNTYSPQEVFDYWTEVTQEFGEIVNFEINNELEFRLEGSSESLEDATKLWHLLSIDDRVSQITLRNVSKEIDSNVVFVSFEGELNYEVFVEQDNK